MTIRRAVLNSRAYASGRWFKRNEVQPEGCTNGGMIWALNRMIADGELQRHHSRTCFYRSTHIDPETPLSREEAELGGTVTDEEFRARYQG